MAPLGGCAMRKLTSFLFLVLLTGCDQSVSLFPVEGPLADARETKIIEGTAHGVDGNSGALSLTLPSGATCTGKWSSVAPQFAAVSSTSLLTTYGNVVGLSISAGPLPGVNRGEAVAVCADGTRIDMEFLTGSGTANGVGVAKDTNGNIYKMLF